MCFFNFLVVLDYYYNMFLYLKGLSCKMLIFQKNKISCKYTMCCMYGSCIQNANIMRS